mmetsp:Transcript_24651/g.79783  ORF Transcript_24651/g.79783 Transcript_24651/m.79783 type:complete len:938 (-) Transcript_24651:64-2877(-)
MGSFLITSFFLLNATLEAANRRLRLRGPQSTTHVSIGGLDYVHNMLSMTGDPVRQPFQDTHAGLVAVFDGEIYNAREVAQQVLQESGSQPPRLRLRSDGEALLPVYRRAGGVGLFRSLDGEWAAVVVDWPRRQITLSRDCFGTKPLHYATSQASGKFALASYRSALIELGFSSHEIRTPPPNSILRLQFADSSSGGASNLKASSHVRSVCEFDLRRWKTSTLDLQAAVLHAVARRAQGQRVFMDSSSGRDSRTLQVALDYLQVAPVHAIRIGASQEDLDVMSARKDRTKFRTGIRTTVVRLTSDDLRREARWLAEHGEPGPADDDTSESQAYRGGELLGGPALCELSHLVRRAKEAVQEIPSCAGRPPVFLSTAGVDWTLLSCHGCNGTSFAELLSKGNDLPEFSTAAFPSSSFFLGTPDHHLAKDERVCGSHGIQARYPFLDRRVVQELLWLREDVKQSERKRPLEELFDAAGKQSDEERSFPVSSSGLSEQRSIAADVAAAADDGSPSRAERPARSLPADLQDQSHPSHSRVPWAVGDCITDVTERLQVWTVSDVQSYRDIYGSEYSLCDLANSARRAGFGFLNVAGLGHVGKPSYWRKLQRKYPKIVGRGPVPVVRKSPSQSSLLTLYPFLRWLVLLEALASLPADVPVLVVDPLDVLLAGGGPEEIASGYCQSQLSSLIPPSLDADELVLLAAETDCYPFAPETSVGNGSDAGFYGEGELFQFGSRRQAGRGGGDKGGRSGSAGGHRRFVHARRICGEFRRSVSARAFPNAGGLIGRAGAVRHLLRDMLTWVVKAKPGNQPWAQPLLYLALLDRALACGVPGATVGTGTLLDADARIFASLHRGSEDPKVFRDVLHGPCGCGVGEQPHEGSRHQAGIWPVVLHFNGVGKRMFRKCATCMLRADASLAMPSDALHFNSSSILLSLDACQVLRPR